MGQRREQLNALAGAGERLAGFCASRGRQPLCLALNFVAIVGISIAIRATGGPPSQLTHLYFIPIIVSALLLPGTVALAVAAAAAVAVSPVADVFNALAGADRYFDSPAPWDVSAGGWILRPATFITVALLAQALARELVRRRNAETALTESQGQLEVLYQDALESKVQLEHSLEVERDRARRDPLTNALNHAAILDELDHMIAGADGRPLTVVVADVDNLKATNDTYGHPLGDRALVAVAQALTLHDAVVGRYGGDEFVAVLPNADRERARRYLDGVLTALSEANLVAADAGTVVPVDASIGLAIYPDEAQTAEDLIRLADNEMYVVRGRPGGDRAAELRFDAERATTLISEIVPLLTSRGSREDKLRLVSQHLSIGCGYDVVNIEVAGSNTGTTAEWQRTFSRTERRELIDAWQRQQNQTKEHPLSAHLARTRRPVFIDDATDDPLLTPEERKLIIAAGLQSGLVVPMLWQDELVGMLSVARRRKAAFRAWDANFLTAVSRHVTAIVFMADLVEELQSASAVLGEARAETVMLLAAAAEAYDDATGRHLRRVRAVSEAIARELGYAPKAAEEIGLAAVLHDVGKIRVPHDVLQSPRKLTDAEWQQMMQHTLWGAEFLGGRKGFELAATVARHHHERWDGAGYPQGLAGEAIAEAAAITAVADSFDAITSDRPYRAGRTPQEAIQEIIACSGKQFSPAVVDAAVRLFERGALPLVDGMGSQRAAA